jgi:hypothetical protein
MLAIGAPAASTGGFSIGAPSQAIALVDLTEVGLAGWVPAKPPPGVSELSLASGYGSTGTAMDDGIVSPSWYATASKFLGPTPTNPQATAGLLMSILLAPLGFIFSIVALAKAGRIHRDGFAPIGRRRAGWGLALSIMALIAIPIGISVGIPMLQHQQELQLEQLAAANSGTDEVPAGQVPIPLAAYDRATFEQGLAEGFTQSAGGAPDSITCPDTVETTVGSSITCEIVYQEQPHTMTMTITNDVGNYTVAVDGVVQE